MTLRTAAKPTGFRRAERWFVGLGFAFLAFFMEKAVLRSIRKGRTKPKPVPQPPTATSKGAEVEQ